MKKGQYTCTEYREEMILVGLRMRLKKPDISEEEKKEIMGEIKKLEAAMEMD